MKKTLLKRTYCNVRQKALHIKTNLSPFFPLQIQSREKFHLSMFKGTVA